MKIVFFGTPHFVIPVLETLTKKFTVVAVATSPDKKAGRKQLMTPSPIKAYVQNELYKSGKNNDDIPIFTPEDFSTLNSQLSTLKPDLFIVAAYGHILPKEVLNIAPFGALNIHPSLLPKFRGPTPVPETILSGEAVTGVTIIKMDEEMDHGPVLAMSSYTIHETDTTETLLTHLFNLSAEMLPDVITNYTNGKITPEAQDHTKATYTKKITKQDGYIDLNSLEIGNWKLEIERKIRAYYPWPTVWTTIQIKDKEARIKFLPGNKIQMEGKNPVSINDFINGYPELENVLKKILDALNL